MARSDTADTFTRTNGKRKQGFSRKGTGVKSPNVYPTNPAARRQLNSEVNKKHSSGWVHVEDEG